MGTINHSIGDHHYMAYVGSPELYDLIGASQFCLLYTLGLRSNHRFLDFGCGSLRAGRLFITYLDEGNYFGIEPNKWLIDDAINQQIGADILNIKKPSFSYNNDFTIGDFTPPFDFILAHSIFTHSGLDLVKKGLLNFYQAIHADGFIIASFLEGSYDVEGDEWIYPEVIPFRRKTIIKLAKNIGLYAKIIPWYHPKLTWYLFAKDLNSLPGPAMTRYLNGAIFSKTIFRSSWDPRERILENMRRIIKRSMPPKLQVRFMALWPRLKQRLNTKR